MVAITLLQTYKNDLMRFSLHPLSDYKIYQRTLVLPDPILISPHEVECP